MAAVQSGAPVASLDIAAAPLTQSDAVASLLSLSFSEGGLAHAADVDAEVKTEPGAHQLPAVHPSSTSVPPSSSLNANGRHHRRLSSTGKTKRRLSDAREAANRPSPSLLGSNAPGLSLASLSLGSSPPPAYPVQLSTSFGSASRRLAPAPPSTGDTTVLPKSANQTGGNSIPVSSSHPGATSIPVKTGGEDEPSETAPISISNGRTGKKRGVDHKCESCSKIYRHPSCLIKHRWEHTPHWREASKFVLSKHQQVQLLEAAAILSHMSPSASGGRSLPEDRSLWPSFLSGGTLPPPDPANRAPSSNGDSSQAQAPVSPTGSYAPSHPVSSSVPTRAMSSGPRLHDYGVSNGLVTQVRPGLIGVTTSTGGVAVIGDRSPNGASTPSQPVPVPGSGALGRSRSGRHGHDAFGTTNSTGSGNYYRQRNTAGGSYGGGESWGSSHDHGASSYHGPSAMYSLNAGGVSLPNSSVRSGSSPPRSLSRSRSGSVEEDGARHPHLHRRHRGQDDGQRNSDDSPASDDGVFDDMDGVEEDQEDDTSRNIRIVGDPPSYGTNGRLHRHSHSRHHTASKSYDSSFSTGYGIYGRRRLGDDDLDYRFAVREEDEDMDEMDNVPRGGKTPAARDEQWDGMEMEMDMD